MNSYDPQYYKEFTGLKSRNPSLKTIISVGGWDAGGQVFSDLAASASKTETFVTSAISFMKQYGFDGIDVDWEYVKCVLQFAMALLTALAGIP